jgi:hypothetical protein
MAKCSVSLVPMAAENIAEGGGSPPLVTRAHNQPLGYRSSHPSVAVDEGVQFGQPGQSVGGHSYRVAGVLAGQESLRQAGQQACCALDRGFGWWRPKRHDTAMPHAHRSRPERASARRVRLADEFVDSAQCLNTEAFAAKIALEQLGRKEKGGVVAACAAGVLRRIGLPAVQPARRLPPLGLVGNAKELIYERLCAVVVGDGQEASEARVTEGSVCTIPAGRDLDDGTPRQSLETVDAHSKQRSWVATQPAPIRLGASYPDDTHGPILGSASQVNDVKPPGSHSRHRDMHWVINLQTTTCQLPGCTRVSVDEGKSPVAGQAKQRDWQCAHRRVQEACPPLVHYGVSGQVQLDKMVQRSGMLRVQLTGAHSAFQHAHRLRPVTAADSHTQRAGPSIGGHLDGHADIVDPSHSRFKRPPAAADRGWSLVAADYLLPAEALSAQPRR